jgi:putative phosphoesterase
MHSFNFDENLITHYGRIKYSFEFDKEKWYKEISNIVKEHNIDYIISGHTHVPEIIKFETCQVLNPGSIEFPFQENKKPSYIIMEINDKEVKINKKFI